MGCRGLSFGPGQPSAGSFHADPQSRALRYVWVAALPYHAAPTPPWRAPAAARVHAAETTSGYVGEASPAPLA